MASSVTHAVDSALAPDERSSVPAITAGKKPPHTDSAGFGEAAVPPFHLDTSGDSTRRRGSGRLRRLSAEWRAPLHSSGHWLLAEHMPASAKPCDRLPCM